jgi:hypothetical protein
MGSRFDRVGHHPLANGSGFPGIVAQIEGRFDTRDDESWRRVGGECRHTTRVQKR